MMGNRLQEKLGLRAPILQAPQNPKNHGRIGEK